MNLPNEQKVLIRDIFNVRVSKEDGGSSMFLLKNFNQQFGVLGPNASLVHNSTYYDSLLMEILSQPQMDILTYLETCLANCSNSIEKPWNKNQTAQNFIKYSQEIIKNFLYLSQSEFQIFSQQLVIDPESRKVNNKAVSIAMRLMTHFERRGMNIQLFQIFYPKLNQQNEGDLLQAFIDILLSRQRMQTIFDAKAYFYANVFETLMSNPEYKIKLMKNLKFPFLPAEASKKQGSLLDKQSSLGMFFRMSIVGHNPAAVPEMKVIERFYEKVRNDIGVQRFGKDRIKYYTDLQNQFVNKLTNISKIFLKKQSQKPFFEYIYAAILGNLDRTKLGSRLQSARNNNISHDGFMMNLYACLLNLCKPFLNIQSGKYTSINPEYYIYNQKIKTCKYEKINKKEYPQETKSMQFGTITQFFFLAFELMHVGVVPCHENFVEDYNQKQKLQKMLDKFPLNNPMRNRIQDQLKTLRAKTVLYFFLLMDDNILNPTIKLFDLLLFLLPNWLNFNYDDLVDGRFVRKYQPSKLVYFLPEHLLQSIFKFHEGVFRYKQTYLSIVGQKHVHQILKVACLALSDEHVISNPYIGANFLQLIFFFLIESKSGIMYQAFKTNTVCHRNFTIGLIKFYSDIAVTGSRNQFYQKFKYRQIVNRIFTALWAHQVYRQNLKSYFKTEVFMRFLNMVIGDTTYCLDESNQKYIKYQQMQIKSQSGKFTEQEQRNFQFLASQLQSTITHSSSNIKLLRDLSKWSPQTFFEEAFLGDIVRLLNNMVESFVNPTGFVANRDLLIKAKFERDIVLSNVVQIYVNLDVSQRFPQEIVKDTRRYKKQYFGKVLQKASNQHQTDITILQKFQELIGKLQTQINQEQDEQIYGEIPDQYLCNLMSTLMNDPVQLPSGYIVDRVYIHKHLLNDERDPFTRAPLKNGEWKELKALKDEISIWKKKRLEELKGANKAVKYGKIGKNKKEEEEQTLYGGGKVINYDEQEEQN